MPLTFSVREGDITQVPADVVVVRYSQQHSVPGGTIAEQLATANLVRWEDLRLGHWEHRLVATEGNLPQRHVLFMGTPPQAEFSYADMHSLASCSVKALATQGITAARLTTRVPRGNAGLDLGESLQKLMDGFSEGCAEFPQTKLQHVEFVERNSRRAAFLASLLSRDDDDDRRLDIPGRRGSDVPIPPPVQPRDACVLGGGSIAGAAKQHVFVAMPFSEQFEDVYELGIYPALRECGFICERLDRSAFTGDILERMKDRIRSAQFVLADLSDARPNVYLEVGYAWGMGVPVLFIARDGEHLHFDVSTHRCLFYSSIRHLKRDLERLARELS